MKNESFYDILIKKIKSEDSAFSPSQTPSSSTSTPNSARSISDEKIASEVLWNSLFTETIHAKLKVTETKAKRIHRSSVDISFIERAIDQAVQTRESRQREMAKALVAERWVLKSTLDEDGIAKWNLFEKTVGIHFGEKTNPAATRSAFRKFIKTVHPDLSGEKATHNFSTLVKIKDEFLRILDISLAAKS